MTAFIVSLWDSIFTPGPTPTLVIATNASFIALISLLTVLAFMTRNIHVFALLAVAIGLCVSVQWFLKELAAVKEEEEKKSKEGGATEPAAIVAEEKKER
ncbi:Pkr1-domain-containing protein [Saitoella complicata NRRL Y-17804]|nr:Pkr1-domain-containing protein [Saitoella complicata NRRL Y-17804]ODQ50990.1 Pkr1-domain-containing protein [Saitoella complicata NRRL Y-17804]